MRNHVCLSIMMLLAACSSTPRVSTQNERTIALALLKTADIGIAVAFTAGKLNVDQHKVAVDSVQSLRTLVNESETVPKNWVDLLDQAEAIMLQWLPYVVMNDKK